MPSGPPREATGSPLDMRSFVAIRTGTRCMRSLVATDTGTPNT